MDQTMFRVDKMDCASEEQLVRMRLGDLPVVKQLDVDFDTREVTVTHDGNLSSASRALDSLGLGARQVEHRPDVEVGDETSPTAERRILRLSMRPAAGAGR